MAKYLHCNLDELEMADDLGFDGLGITVWLCDILARVGESESENRSSTIGHQGILIAQRGPNHFGNGEKAASFAAKAELLLDAREITSVLKCHAMERASSFRGCGSDGTEIAR